MPVVQLDPNKPITEVMNLLLNVASGVEQEWLTPREVELLEKEFGTNWAEQVFGNK